MDRRVTVVTPVRDGARLLDPYVGRLESLDYPRDRLRVAMVEGDSVDDTRERIRQWQARDSRVALGQCDTGGPRYGSVVNPERFAILAAVFNTGLAMVDMVWSDFVLFLPFDIDYRADLLRRLLAHNMSVIAPFVYLPDGRFYDIWAFSRAGRRFNHFQERDAARLHGADPIPMDTVGGTLLLSAEVLLTGVRYTPDEVDRGLCYKARARGFTVWADPATAVYHPAPER